MARLNACGVEADAVPRRGLTLRVQADAFPTARQAARRAKQPTRASRCVLKAARPLPAKPQLAPTQHLALSSPLHARTQRAALLRGGVSGAGFVRRQPLRSRVLPPSPFAAQLRASQLLRGGGSRGYRRARDITPSLNALAVAANAAGGAPRSISSTRRQRWQRRPAYGAARPFNRRYVQTPASASLRLPMRAAPAAQVPASCGSSLRAVHGLRRPHAAARNARAPARRRPPELAHGLDASMRFLSSPSMARQLRKVHELRAGCVTASVSSRPRAGERGALQGTDPPTKKRALPNFSLTARCCRLTLAPCSGSQGQAPFRGATQP